jgi:UDP-N-acetyl-D-mannosaminuronate dehydrogenase
MKKIGIIGYGEIGSSLEKVYLGKEFDIRIRDLNRDDGLKKVDVLNICIPYNNEFINNVTNYIKELDPKLTIIHSTVIPGTTEQISLFSDYGYVVHSPVRGVHPKLYEGLKTFVKYVGADNTASRDLICDHYDKISIKYEVFKNSKSTELAKILCTTYYGLCIAWHDDVNMLCQKYDVPFEEVMSKWNATYNEGYEKLGMKNVTRPVLYPPSGRTIGGHCVIPNTKLCMEFFESLALDYIYRLK